MSDATREAREPDEELLPCDLVIQGGVTSGLVYPGAIVELAKERRFHHIGGASAGAIAAAAAAAAEYGRSHAGRADSFDLLERAIRGLAEGDNLLRLFEPVPRGRLAFDVLLTLVSGHDPMWRRGVAAAGRLLRARAVLVAGVLAAAVTGVSAAAVLRQAGPAAASLRGAVFAWAAVTWLLLVAAILGLLLALFVRGLVRTIEGNRFALCDGRALTEWIHRNLQAIAGTAETLTFRGLAEAGIHLRLVATDLSEARPVSLPLREDQALWFEESALTALLPEPVAEHVRGTSPRSRTAGGRTYHLLSSAEMPVTLGVRLSLSFPILLSAVPLHVLPADGAGEPRTHWMSDGGITSNFPIQLFDEWLPDHPTFGLDLLPAQGHRTGVLLSPDPQPVRWMETANLIDFLSQLLDASRNWRDTMQAELADSRDRICHIYLSKDEGGLNLRMGPGVSGRLIERGKQAGRQFTVERRFDWDRHRRGRWLTLMRMMQRGLERAGASLPGYRPLLAGDAAAATVTQDLVGMSAEVSAVPLFARTPEPPAPVMRIDPDV